VCGEDRRSSAIDTEEHRVLQVNEWEPEIRIGHMNCTGDGKRAIAFGLDIGKGEDVLAFVADVGGWVEIDPGPDDDAIGPQAKGCGRALKVGDDIDLIVLIFDERGTGLGKVDGVGAKGAGVAIGPEDIAARVETHHDGGQAARGGCVDHASDEDVPVLGGFDRVSGCREA